MSSRGVVITGVLALGLAAIAVWWFSTFERVQRNVELPPRGEARYNPLFALRRTLEALSVPVRSRANLNLERMRLQPGDTLLFGADVRSLAPNQIEGLLRWVEDGGHLVFALPQAGGSRPGALLDRLGIEPVDAVGCIAWKTQADEKPQRLCHSQRFTIQPDRKRDLIWHWGKARQGYAFGRLRHGDGSVEILPSLGFLSGRQLDEPGNAALALQLLAPFLHQGTVHLVYAPELPPAYLLLLRYGWPLLLPLGLALLAWLWARSQRLGPVLPQLAPDRRALLEHIQAAGEFVFRQGEAASLQAALRQRFLERLQRIDPVLAALPERELIAALSAQWQLPLGAVRAALQIDSPQRAEHFVAAIRHLHRLSLHP